MDTDVTRTRWKLFTRLVVTATTPDPAEGNAQFLKCLEAVYNTSKKLENEVASATTTKKEIKTLVATLSNDTKGLMHWGKSTGRVKNQMISRCCQAGTTVSTYDENGQLTDEMRHQRSDLLGVILELRR